MRRLNIPPPPGGDPFARLRGHVPPLADVFDEDNDVDAAESPEEEDNDEPLYEQVGLGTRAREDEELGTPDDRSTCFGCIFMGERETGAVQQEDLVSLMDMVVRSIGQTDQICLVNEVAKRYKRIQEKTNRHLLPHERPLPDWSPATILDHFRWHHADPEFHLWMGLRDVREAKDVALHAMVECNRRTKKRRLNKDQVKAYTDLCKLEWQLAKIDPSKCTFFSSGKHLDTQGVSQGPLAMSFKPMVKMFERGNKR